MKRKILFAVAFSVTLFTTAQNVEFKAANFKEKKEELKQAIADIEAGDTFLELANQAVIDVKSPDDNFKKALKEDFGFKKFMYVFTTGKEAK